MSRAHRRWRCGGTGSAALLSLRRRRVPVCGARAAGRFDSRRPAWGRHPTGPENHESDSRLRAPVLGNALNCTSCHLDGGRTPYAAPLVGIWGVFPEYRSRNARVNILEDRINDCFERSMNGRRASGRQRRDARPSRLHAVVVERRTHGAGWTGAGVPAHHQPAASRPGARQAGVHGQMRRLPRAGRPRHVRRAGGDAVSRLCGGRARSTSAQAWRA